MDFLLHKGLVALAGSYDNPGERQRLFERLGGGEVLSRLGSKIDTVCNTPCLEAADPFDFSFPDPNLVAEYFDDPLRQSSSLNRYEEACRQSDSLFAEAVLTARVLRLFEQEATSAPKSCRQRAYQAAEREESSGAEPSSFSGGGPDPAPVPRRLASGFRSLFHSSGSPEPESDRSFARKPQPHSLPKRAERSFSDELAQFQEEVPDRHKRKHRTAPKPETAKVSTEEPPAKRRGAFLPFVCASIAAALLFHFRPLLQSVPERRIPPASAEVTQTVSAPPKERSEEPAADPIGEFEEAPIAEKIATPPEPNPEPAGGRISAQPAAAAAFSWRELTLLSDAERGAMTGVRPVCRPLRRGMKTDVVTAIPEME